MNLNVKFSESNQSFDLKLGEVHNISDGGYERGYATGYEKGNAEGYDTGHAEGVEQGYADGYGDGVESVPDYLFLAVNNSITEYTSSKVTSIRACAFRAASRLVKVDLPNATSGGNYGFMECSSLREVNLPSLNSLGQNFFSSCSSLERLVLPKITTVTASCFSSCTKLATLILSNNEVCTLNNTSALGGTPIASGRGFIYVPDNLVEQYKTATNWSTYATQIKPLSELEE